MVCTTGQSVHLASSQAIQNWEEWVIHQTVPLRGTSAGWRNGLRGISLSSARGNAKSCLCREVRRYTLRTNLVEGSSAEKNLGSLVDNKLTMRRQNVFVAEKANGILGCIRQRLVSGLREVILPLSLH